MKEKHSSIVITSSGAQVTLGCPAKQGFTQRWQFNGESIDSSHPKTQQNGREFNFSIVEQSAQFLIRSFVVHSFVIHHSFIHSFILDKIQSTFQ